MAGNWKGDVDIFTSQKIIKGNQVRFISNYMKVTCHCDFIPFSQESRSVCNGEWYALYLNVCAKKTNQNARGMCAYTHTHAHAQA